MQFIFLVARRVPDLDFDVTRFGEKQM